MEVGLYMTTASTFSIGGSAVAVPEAIVLTKRGTVVRSDRFVFVTRVLAAKAVRAGRVFPAQHQM